MPRAAVSDWPPVIFLDPGSTEPAYLQISRALRREIERGRLSPGDALPGYRTLAEQLGVSRNTVMAAYRELQAGGWVLSVPGEGSTVAARRAAPAAPAAMGFDLGTPAPAGERRSGRAQLSVATGTPDPRLVPGALLARAYRRSLTVNRRSGLEEEEPQGHPRLREALARMLAGTRGIPAAPERILVTRGSQMAFYLVAQALFAPGDAVAVEELGNRGAWEAFARAGARCLPVPVDAEGVDVERLAQAAASAPLRAVFVTPQRHYPTLVPLSPERRRRLLALAAGRRAAVLESDQDSEFHFDGRPLPPLAADDAAGVVVHVGTLSKMFAPGLRLGFVHAPAPLVARMREVRAVVDRQGDPALERAMAELMEDGELQRHLRRMRETYRRRRDALVRALARELGSALSVEPPAGGLAVWAVVRDGIDAGAWAARALEHGVAVRAGRHFHFCDAPVPGLRIGFSNYAEPELEEVARRLRAALPEAA